MFIWILFTIALLCGIGYFQYRFWGEQNTARFLKGENDRPREKRVSKVSRESESGYHFHNTYQNCPRKFYIRYILKYLPLKVGKALLFGISIHKAIETFYVHFEKPKEEQCNHMVMEFRIKMEECLSQYEQTEDYVKDLERGVELIKKWVELWGDWEKETYDVLEIEQEHRIELPNGTIMTIRPDRVLRMKRSNVAYIFDTKTTSYSPSAPGKSLEMGDQATAYIYGISKVHPEWRVTSLIPDVLYNKGNVYKCEKGTPIYRTRRDLEQFEISMVGVSSEIAQKTNAILSGQTEIPELVFPRNGAFCSLFGCEYSDICRMRLQSNDCPQGFFFDGGEANED